MSFYKWILGYGKEFYSMAEKVVDLYESKQYKGKYWVGMNQDEETKEQREEKGDFDYEGDDSYKVHAIKYCYDAAKEIRKLGYHEREKAVSIYDKIVKRKEFMVNSRLGFYCMLCSVEGQR